METSKILIYACGICSVAFAVFHMLFWKLFRWKEDLQKISLANKAIIQIANLRLNYIFLITGLACFLFPVDLRHTKPGNFFLIAMSLFWMGRTIEQFIFLRIRHLKIFILTILFIAASVLFLLPLLF